MEEKTLKGTTTVGLVCSDGIVLIADKRASMGSFIASKRAKKTFNLNDMVGATIAGSVGDADALMRLIKAEAALYEINNRKKMSAKAIASLMSNILHGSKYFPYLVQLIIAGFDGDRAALYTLDPVGGLTDEVMAATGSGSPMAYGVLEQSYNENKKTEENIPISIRALNSAMQRDSATGDGMSLVTITKDGFREYTEKEIKEIADKIKK
ncbi:MAG: archaeal proteasome endopeptidase complex subunit beta [Candidatus Altiarchaeota archaeon]|nr:archaeal proteasome endopeptidase complex subunit beta [Candidatus Altiarchaeota archaeon]